MRKTFSHEAKGYFHKGLGSKANIKCRSALTTTKHESKSKKV